MKPKYKKDTHLSAKNIYITNKFSQDFIEKFLTYLEFINEPAWAFDTEADFDVGNFIVDSYGQPRIESFTGWSGEIYCSKEGKLILEKFCELYTQL